MPHGTPETCWQVAPALPAVTLDQHGPLFVPLFRNVSPPRASVPRTHKEPVWAEGPRPHNQTLGHKSPQPTPCGTPSPLWGATTRLLPGQEGVQAAQPSFCLLQGPTWALASRALLTVRSQLQLTVPHSPVRPRPEDALLPAVSRPSVPWLPQRFPGVALTSTGQLKQQGSILSQLWGSLRTGWAGLFLLRP